MVMKFNTDTLVSYEVSEEKNRDFLRIGNQIQPLRVKTSPANSENHPELFQFKLN